LGNHGLWLAMLLYLLTRGLVQTLCYRHKMWYVVRRNNVEL